MPPTDQISSIMRNGLVFTCLLLGLPLCWSGVSAPKIDDNFTRLRVFPFPLCRPPKSRCGRPENWCAMSACPSFLRWAWPQPTRYTTETYRMTRTPSVTLIALWKWCRRWVEAEEGLTLHTNPLSLAVCFYGSHMLLHFDFGEVLEAYYLYSKEHM